MYIGVSAPNPFLWDSWKCQRSETSLSRKPDTRNTTEILLKSALNQTHSFMDLKSKWSLFSIVFEKDDQYDQSHIRRWFWPELTQFADEADEFIYLQNKSFPLTSYFFRQYSLFALQRSVGRGFESLIRDQPAWIWDLKQPTHPLIRP